MQDIDLLVMKLLKNENIQVSCLENRVVINIYINTLKIANIGENNGCINMNIDRKKDDVIIIN